MRWIFILSLLVSAAAIVGCDQGGPTVPATGTETATAAHSTPTTQRLLEGPRTQVDLKVIPMTLRVPESWKLDFLGASMLLEGPAPHGDIEIALAALPQLEKDRVDLLIADSKVQLANNPEHYHIGPIESINGLRALETMRTRGASTQSTTQFSLAPILSDSMPSMVSWNLIVFVPRGAKFVPSNFSIRLTQRQYDADADFIRSILQSARQHD
jgi:hypothetical protein